VDNEVGRQSSASNQTILYNVAIGSPNLTNLDITPKDSVQPSNMTGTGSEATPSSKKSMNKSN
jgi:hypothetical protein